MKISKSNVGKIAHVVFDDHAENSTIIRCEVWGKVIHVDDSQIVIRSWNCVDMPNDDSNHEHFSLVKSAIKHFKVLR
jgi:hypothetical protein